MTPRLPLVFVGACLWVAVCLTAGRSAALHGPAAYADLIQQAVIALLLFGGFYLMASAAVPDLRALSSVGFVQRPGFVQELGLGAALGWGIAIALVLPALLTGSLHATVVFNTAALGLTLQSAAVLLLYALNVQMIVSGLPARLLLRLGGPALTGTATVFVVVLLIFLGEAGRSPIFAAMAAALFTTAFLRTRAAWLPLGLQAGWTLSLQLLFGLPSPYTPPSAGMVQGQSGARGAWTGGIYGPEASGVAWLVLLIAFVVLVRLTRDYAWHYTYQPAEAAGYAMDIQPPAEHLREESRAAAAVPLVQIAGVTKTPDAETSAESGH